jgi:hypothetical protein
MIHMTAGAGEDKLKIFFISSSSNLATSIASVVENFNSEYRIDRWKEEQSPGTVTLKIIERIHQADVVVADLSSDNPNVYYELGIAHSLVRPTILFKLKSKPLPFDVYGERALEVEVGENGDVANTATLETKLRKALTSVKDNPGITGTAIQQYLQMSQATPQLRDVWREIAVAGESTVLSPSDAKVGTWIYEAKHGLGEIIDVSDESADRKRLRIEFADGSGYRELYLTADAHFFIAPLHVQAMLRRRRPYTQDSS